MRHGLGETQVFQDEKSRLANTTVARIVAQSRQTGRRPFPREDKKRRLTHGRLAVPAGVGLTLGD